MKKRAISLLLAFVMLFSLLPVQVFAAEEPEYLPEAEIEEQYVSDGAFYFASAGAELYENTGSGYLLKVARWGDGEEAASVRLTMTDVTASYGEDYTVSLYGAGLFEGIVKNGAKSESMLEYLQNHETKEYNYSDAIIDGTITAEDQPAEGEENIELTEEQKSEIENASNELMAAISGTSTDEVETTVYDAESAGSVLSAAREKATGLKDDREPAAYGAPAVSGTGSSSDSVANMADSITEVSNALNASYIVINFDEGMLDASYLANDSCRSEAYGENGWLLYAHKHRNNVEVAADFRYDEWHYDYSGFEVYWSRRADKPTWGRTRFWSFFDVPAYETLYDKGTERWSNHTDRYFLGKDPRLDGIPELAENPVTTGFRFTLRAETGFLAKNPTLELKSVRPILRPFRITMMGADPIKLIDSNGNKVENPFL